MSDQLTGRSVDAPLSSRRNHWVNHLERHAFQIPDRPALRFAGVTTAWGELRERVAALADALSRRGVGYGDRVAILMYNRPEFIETMLATNRLGAIAVPVNFRLSPKEMAFILDDCGAALLVAENALAAAAVDACAHMPGSLRLVVSGADTGAAGENAELYAHLMDDVGDPHPAVDVDEAAPALILYTSGTTGRPKGAVLSHQNLQGQALTITRAWRLWDGDEISLCASPLFHSGAIGSVIPLILIGGCLVIMPTGQLSAGQVLDTLESEKVTSAFLVPTLWQSLCDDPSVSSRDLSHLRITSWGAAPATDTLLNRMAEVFPGAVNVALFGQTEMSPVTCVLDGKDALRKLGSVGKPISTLAVRVVDDRMNDVAPGEVGEIVYRGPTMMTSYWNNPRATAEAFEGGWFHSGDLVRVDDEGFFYVVDRTKDMIISGGENIYCAEVENALAAHPNVLEISVIGRPHERWGETPVAVIVPRDPVAGLTVAEIRQWAQGRLAKYKLPTEVHIVRELPRNAGGKVVKGALRDTFGGR
ncbi:long-chain-fatty-acid--CoA ligase [Streptomyces sp. NPDC004609]|uniref:long-chain-fatty-acid--CoA ligase n=1 Tax=Streptomyces sp. NPDC004609 TaxID=3364704 RepID=UPI0036C3F7CF